MPRPFFFFTSQRLRVKLALDTDPPPEAEFHVETLLVPNPFQVKLYTRPCLFAGKVHALLCRDWKQRVKGRDFYDFIWYLGRETPLPSSPPSGPNGTNGTLGFK
ncbi:MAG: nucleotidyl transferase AbiEii/AbiGii toxin family protein [Verrucomicrobiales bacterium]